MLTPSQQSEFEQAVEETEAPIVRVWRCAWCGLWIDERGEYVSPAERNMPQEHDVSHGICKKCLEIEKAKLIEIQNAKGE